MKNIYLFLILGVLFSACSSGENKSVSKGKSSVIAFESTKWLLKELNGKRVLIPEGGNEVFVKFESGGRASGSAGCNTFTGSYTRSGKSLSFGPAATTRKMCPSQMDTEQDFLQMLTRCASHKISGTKLTMMDGNGSAIAVFDGFVDTGLPGN